MKTPWLLVVVFAFAFGGCASELSDAAGNKSADESVGQTVESHVADSESPYAASMRNVIRNGSMAVRVPDVEKAEKLLSHDVAALGGYIASSASAGYGSGDPRVELNLKIPAGKLDRFIESVSAYGVVTEKQLSSEDVTDQLIDADARLKTLTVQESRYRELLVKATNINQVAEIESKLGEVRIQIEKIAATRKSMADRAVMSELQIVLNQDATTQPGSPGQRGWLNEAWGQATGSFIAFIQVAGTTAVWLVVFSPVWGVLAGGTWLVARQSKRKR